MDYRSFSVIPGLTENIFSDRFNQIDQMFSKLTGKKPLSENPDYDFLKKNNEEYKLRISVPGYKKNELEIIIENNKLIIKGKSKEKTNKEKRREFIYKGISKKSFSINFNLDHKLKTKKAKLKNGILEINFTYDLPKQKEPKQISIE